METIFDIKNIQAIIGLGNPGARYYNNRHSIGFRIVDEVAVRLGASWHYADLMEYASVRPEDSKEIFLIKPQTFMNNSGKVLPWLLKKGIKPENIVVAHDELEKSFGTVVLTFGGSHKGHNGLKSVMSLIGPDFWHLKFGIGRPVDKNDVPDYVLTNFPKEQEQFVTEIIDKACNLLML